MNRVTPELFRRFPTPAALSQAEIAEVETLIRTLGLFRAKATSLKRCAQQLRDEFNGEVPATMEELTRLAGVGRKTANVILGHAFNKPGIAVDTHCKRLSRRLGLTASRIQPRSSIDSPDCSAGRMDRFFFAPVDSGWARGCYARKPACKKCVFSELCPSGKTFLDA